MCGGQHGIQRNSPRRPTLLLPINIVPAMHLTDPYLYTTLIGRTSEQSLRNFKVTLFRRKNIFNNPIGHYNLNTFLSHAHILTFSLLTFWPLEVQQLINLFYADDRNNSNRRGGGDKAIS
jgi:hypothetical protein